MSVIQLRDLCYRYSLDDAFELRLTELTIEKASRLFIEGPSGSGKTTFLNLITGLLVPTSGQCRILGTDLGTLNAAQRDTFRADHFGIIFQQFNLIEYLSVTENIVLPCMFSNSKREKVLSQSSTLEAEATRLCQALDIDDTLMQKPVQALSIGQQQRVAIARALIGQPDIIIADEPTSALDNDRKEQFMSVLISECEKVNATLLFVSHDTTLKTQFNAVYALNELNEAVKGGSRVSV